MSASSLLPYRSRPADGRAVVAERRAGSASLRKAVLLPAAMFVLLSLIPLLRTGARYPFLLVLVPLILVSAFVDTELAIYSYIAWCWMDASIRGLFGGGAVTSLGRDAVLVIVVVGWLAQRIGSRYRDPVRTPPVALLIGLFAANCFVQIFNPYSLGLLSTLAGLKVELSSLAICFVAYDVFRRTEQLRSLAIFLTLATLAICSVALVQYAHGQAWTFAHYPGAQKVLMTMMRNQGLSITDADKALFRPPGTTNIGGGTGVFVSFVLPLTFALVLMRGRQAVSGLWRAGLLAVVLVFAVTIMLGALRISICQAIEGLVFCGVLAGGKIRSRVLMTAAALLCLALIAYSATTTLSQGALAARYASLFANPVNALHQDRKTFFQQLPSMIVQSPFGVGLGRTGAAAGYFGTQSDDIGFVAFSESYLGDEIYESGLLGALLIAAIGCAFIFVGVRHLRRAKDIDERLLCAALCAILATMFVDLFVESVLSQPPGSVLFWLIGGALMRMTLTVPTRVGRSDDVVVGSLEVSSS